MENSLPFFYVLLPCLRCANFSYKRSKRELSEYKAIGMIQDHYFFCIKPYSKNSRNNKDFNPPVPSCSRKMGGNLIDMRRKQSLISWVLSMSIVDRESKRKLHNFKKRNLSRVYFVCSFLKIPNI